MKKRHQKSLGLEARRSVGIYLFSIFFLLPSSLSAQDKRDPWLWPFSEKSIWNMPIGSEAVYVRANLPPSKHYGADLEWHIKVHQGDPVYKVYAPSSWMTRWPGTKEIGELQFPEDLIIPDARKGYTPNACAVFLMPDGRTIRQLEPACRPEKSKRIVGFLSKDQDLYGEGVLGTHWGSGLSSLGGSIRPGELTSDKPIRHALKINIWAEKFLNYSKENSGYRWPAVRSDRYAAERYGGRNPKLVMGSLLAIRKEVSLEKLNLETCVARKLFYALQNYGAYISDDSAWDATDFCVERTVPTEVKNKYGYSLIGKKGPFVNDIKKIIILLHIIDNNTPKSIGGGGIPRMPLAPKLVPVTNFNQSPGEAWQSPPLGEDLNLVARSRPLPDKPQVDAINGIHPANAGFGFYTQPIKPDEFISRHLKTPQATG